MTPLQAYQQHLAKNNFYADPQQEQVILQLQQVFDDLAAADLARTKTKSRLLDYFKLTKSKVVPGVYLWGSVGAGKTWLMDIFYEALPGHNKKRWHFHRFMQHVHFELKQLQGHPNPLQDVAKRFAKQFQIICLDEFWVTDITDAMLLANLLSALFAEGITLVTTANVPPAELYRNGLQRARFLPAIALLQQHLHTLHLVAQQDYRLRPQKPAGNYFYPLDDYAARCMQESFAHFAHYAGLQGDNLEINGRTIACVRRDKQVIWFDFKEICNAPRSQLDYLQIARKFSTVLISNIPQITAQEKNSASYLIKLVDVFYDERIQLVISAAVDVLNLYPEGDLSGDFKRTESRLIEMQGQEYLAQCERHR